MGPEPADIPLVETGTDVDELTGLASTTVFRRALARHAAGVSRFGHVGAVIVIRVDEPSARPGVGDPPALVTAAQAFAGRLRQTDVLARTGESELAVLLPRATADQAEVVARSLDEVARHGALSVRIGAAAFGPSLPSGPDVLASAREAAAPAGAAGDYTSQVTGRGFARKATSAPTASARKTPRSPSHPALS